MAKYLKINGKVCLDTWQGMLRGFFRPLFPKKNDLELDVHAFLGQYGVGKDGLGFLEQEAFVINAGAVVADAKAGNLGGLGKACCLRGGGVGVLACTWFHLMWIGGLMIEQRDILEQWS